MEELNKILCTLLLFAIIDISSVQGHAKVNENRTKHHEGGDRIHVRHAGLDNFADDQHAVNVLKNEQFVRNKEHISEHAKHENFPFDPATATADQLDYHFFDIHDTDQNKKLDGLELLAAIFHGLEEQFEDVEDDEDMKDAEREQEMDHLNVKAYASVDKVLQEDDIDKDGYLSVGEFMEARHATAVIRNAHHEDYNN